MDNNKSNREFKTGDTVQLKSGGPFMTVNKLVENGKIYCKWFTKDEDKVSNGYFSPNALQLVVKPHKKGTVKYRDL